MTAPQYRYGEALKNEGVIPRGHGVYTQSETKEAELGARVAFADGRVFRYAKAGATNLSPGKICKAGGVVAQSNKTVNAAVSVGGYEVTLQTSSAATTLEEGYLQINDVAGEGIQYKIKKASANATTSAYTDLELYDPIATALTTSSQGTLIYNLYEQAELISAITDIVIGVPPISVTAEYYFWLQTWGIANVLSEGTPAAGVQVEAGVNSQPGGTTTYAAGPMIVGMQLALGVATEYKPVFLMIAP